MARQRHIDKWPQDLKDIWITGAGLKSFQIPCHSFSQARILRNNLYLVRRAFMFHDVDLFHKIQPFQISQKGNTLVFTRRDKNTLVITNRVG